MDARRKQAHELRSQIEWTLARAIDPSDVLPMLHRLARLAQDGSEDSLFAHLHLAELLVERDPWRAALFARRVLVHRPEDDRGWATLALCQTLLGHYKFAVTAYHRALGGAPKNPWYAHNLGHLLDVALDRAGEAVSWLEQAHQSAPESGDVAASYAHALARIGRLAEARKVLTRATKRGASREHAALLRWLEQGAPADKDHPLPRPAPVHAMAASDLAARLEEAEAEAPSRKSDEAAPSTREGRRPKAPPAVGPGEIEGVLARGLASLPLDPKQRARAKSLARDAMGYLSRPASTRGARGARGTVAHRGSVDAIAAAVAYAIVYVDHVPLTQAEVAACFRVSVASLRGRFGELRSHLDLLPGDARYATLRRR
ncbi:MAG TPA: tetratricopeptide repeat protein [Polyangiaceae bacterium]|jgi:tetratricopeptide (TPR) repeat protein|nr:tetratricopeptide repeat protein [Polyangiaceae bacterium]